MNNKVLIATKNKGKIEKYSTILKKVGVEKTKEK